MDESERDLVDDYLSSFVKPLGNLVITFALAEAELLNLVSEMLGDNEIEAVTILKSSDAKQRVLNLTQAIGSAGHNLQELMTGIEGFWSDKEKRNRLIHDRWFLNLYEGSVLTRVLTKAKVPQEMYGSPTVEDVWELARRFQDYDNLFSHRAWVIRRTRGATV